MKVVVLLEFVGRSERREVQTTSGLLTVGRSLECSIPIESALVSRSHIVLDVRGPSLRVEDTSTNGSLVGSTYLNATSVTVPYGTPITIGECTLSVESPHDHAERADVQKSKITQRPPAPSVPPAEPRVPRASAPPSNLRAALTPRASSATPRTGASDPLPSVIVDPADTGNIRATRSGAPAPAPPLASSAPPVYVPGPQPMPEAKLVKSTLPYAIPAPQLASQLPSRSAL